MKVTMKKLLKPGHPQGPPLRKKRRRLGPLPALLFFLPSIWACDDNPFQVRWELNPDTVLIYSLARPEMNLASAFDFVGRTKVRVESPSAVGEWDLAVDTRDGAIVFVPPGAIGVLNSTARVAPMGNIDFDDLQRAPRDTTLYIGDRPVQAEVGQLYVVRTRQKVGGYGTRCVYYGKIEPIEADPLEGTLTFVFDISPVCNDRKLFPPKD